MAEKLRKSMEDVPEKRVKLLDKMFVSLKNAGKSGAAGALSSVFDQLGPAAIAFEVMASILKPFEPILEVISVLFEALGAGIMKELIKIVKPLIPLLAQLAPLFELIGTAIGWMIRMGLLPFVLVIYGFGVAIAAIVDFVTGIIDAIDFLNLTSVRGTHLVRDWNDLMLPIIASIAAPPEFHSGTTYVPKTGPYILEQGERVVSREDRLSNLRREYHLERQTAALERLVVIKEEGL